MQSKAASVAEYIASLQEDRKVFMEVLRDVINRSLQPGFQEGMQYGMIGWFVPHNLYPKGYHADPKQPLPYMALASQKNSVSLYMNCIHSEGELEEFRNKWLATGRKLNMGKSCVRLKRQEDAALELIAEWVGKASVKSYIQSYEAAIGPGLRAKG